MATDAMIPPRRLKLRAANAHCIGETGMTVGWALGQLRAWISSWREVRARLNSRYSSSEEANAGRSMEYHRQFEECRSST